MTVRSELIQVAASAMAAISIIDKGDTSLGFNTPRFSTFDLIYAKIATDVARERLNQERKWGTRFDNDGDIFWWLAILGEEVGESCEAALEAHAAGTLPDGWPEEDE